MTLTINTNLSSMVAQKNLIKATSALNTSIERMTTGYKINHAKDNAAGYAIIKNWETQLSSLDVAADNAATGADMLTTLEDNYTLISTHLQRVRDLTEQASNGTYGESALASVKAEISSRLEEIERISSNCEFNGKKLMNGGGAVNIQVGIYGDINSKISLAAGLFAKSDMATLFSTETTKTPAAIATNCTTAATANGMLTKIDAAIKTISDRATTIGAAQNRIDSAIESIGVQTENITSSLSTIRDTDVAKESSTYIKAQILQQAAATLLATANQTPSLALSLI